jgi:hypothetical protein
MTYSVHQHWDPLKVCAVGQSYPPEFYSFITNSRVRTVMERIASETEEDYQKLIKLLESFGVETLRPMINEDFSVYLKNGKYVPSPMTPCDFSIMIGETFYHNWCTEIQVYQNIAADHWPKISTVGEYDLLPDGIKQEVQSIIDKHQVTISQEYKHILQKISAQGNKVVERAITDVTSLLNRAMTTRIGKDLYFGTENYDQDQIMLKKRIEKLFPDYRCHVINTGGHSDGTFCPIVPGLIVSLYDVPSYAETFPDWEVVYLPGQSWSAVKPFLDLKEKNKGKWWVPGEELNNDFTNFVEDWLGHWVGYVEETVFDVNMLVIDEKNVVCNNYNEQVFKAFDRHGITPHIVNFRHRYFWDGGLHCITSDLHREGTQKDYFPERGLT